VTEILPKFPTVTSGYIVLRLEKFIPRSKPTGKAFRPNQFEKFNEISSVATFLKRTTDSQIDYGSLIFSRPY